MSNQDIKFMKQAEKAAESSGCIRNESQIGAVAVRDGRVILHGSNHTIKGLKSCKECGECLRQKKGIQSGTQKEIARCICAEQDIICKAAKEGIALGGATIYVTHMPCSICIRLIIEAGIKNVVYKKPYDSLFSLELAKGASFEMKQMIE